MLLMVCQIGAALQLFLERPLQWQGDWWAKWNQAIDKTAGSESKMKNAMAELEELSSGPVSVLQVLRF